MTEEEAKKKFCPYSMDNVVMATCIASKCMAWLWDEKIVGYDHGEAMMRIDRTQGHCGLVK